MIITHHKTRDQIINLILRGSDRDLTTRAEMEFGTREFDVNFSRVGELEIQHFYQEYLNDERDGVPHE